ncbi:MAG: heme lyase CcmF/NrfE family subunit [Gammaproteobacteria bacterium]|nr:heme lyase CcmF/NrfE family subunit [Gammaproteobacteria bacterium]MBT3868554.1 heme lyase CcmF/NrfE family subunit [Gammaproteobacteria bacterium]MBT4379847.1 heme lyase CcmF/NrfE family subunit [Gammaproteobacteria bacterium]MBT4619328.1 heme lyase CcmF/NrfE family subunit [Gammaproteobacteria bacterium]MBT5196546.1 heme lyase CcmF/NrfE family subunit [Gammaproteobacteria bacterium]
MIPEFGHFSLILALGLSVALAVLPALGVYRRDALLMQTGPSIATGLFVLLAFSFGCLMYSFIQDDFSVAYVANNSNSALPLQYKISAVWGAHEGSFLLWTLIASGWTLAVAAFSRGLTFDMKARVLSVLGLLCAGFTSFLLFTSNPFDRNLPFHPADGADLNPLLQDFGLIVHPPMLYMGYVGFAVPFALAIATLTTGRLDAAWARWSRPWTNAAWAFLTVGITLGSWWAYYELGWGGWWFWDAVENASFMPWLMGIALIHSLAASEKRGVFKSWTVLLAISTFSLSLLGAFLVRSGVLTSVHAFAVDPTRGVYILVFLVLVIGGSLTLYAWKASGIKSEAQFEWNSREAMLLINNLLLVVATASVLLGTLYPLLYEVITDGKKISVGPPYFNRVFVPIVCLLFVAMAVSPFSRWRRTSGDVLLRQHWPFLLATPVVICLVTYLVATGIDLIAIGVETLAVWILVLLARHWWQAGSISSASQLGMMLAHAGIAVAILGVVVTITYSEGRDVRMNPGESIALAGYDFTFEGVQKVRGPNYLADQAEFNVTRGGEFVAKLRPEKRFYSVGQNVMTEADMDPGLMRDVYVALGEKVGDTAWAVRVHVKPFVRWIWLGGLLVALGGFVTLLDKRYRRVRGLVSNNVVGTAA